MSCDLQDATNVDQFLVTGRIKYFAPTRGRVMAMKNGYYATQRAMKLQGISKSNKLYDFRVTPKDESYYNAKLGDDTTFMNLATLDGSNPLTLLDNPAGSPGRVTSLFDAHNDNIEPITLGTPTFGGGLSIQSSGVTPPNDFVLNEGLIHEGRSAFADTNYEYIPFTVEYDGEATGKSALQFEWQPDPQLYLSVLGGWFEIQLDQVDAEFDGVLGIAADLEVAIEIAGWKSILGSKKKKSRLKRYYSKSRMARRSRRGRKSRK